MNDNEAEKLLALRRQLVLSRTLVGAAKADGLSFFRPYHQQDLFFQNGDKKRRMVRAGNRTGKTTVGVAEDAAWLKGERTWYKKSFDVLVRSGKETKVVREHKGSETEVLVTRGIPRHKVKGLCVTTDWDKIDENITGTDGKLWKFLPKDFIKSRRKNHNGVTAFVECQNGSTLRFDTVKSFLNDPQSAESTDWDFIHIDEPIPQAMWKAISRGLVDRGGSAWLTLTPLREPWINDMFFPRGDEGQEKLPGANFWSIQAQIYDNPYLTVEDIELFSADLTDDEKQCRLLGLPLHLSGLVYKNFNYGKHVLTTPPKGWLSLSQPPTDWPVYLYIDNHPQTPHCVLFLTVSPKGQVIYFYDMFIHCGPETLAKTIKEFTKDMWVVRGRIDPSAYIQDPIVEGATFADELIRHGVYVEKASKDLSGGILRANEALGRGIRDKDVDQQIYVTACCRRFLYEVQRYCWDEKENKPVDKDDHCMENFYRSVIDQPTWMEKGSDNTEGVEDEEFTHDLSNDLDEVLV